MSRITKAEASGVQLAAKVYGLRGSNAAPGKLQFQFHFTHLEKKGKQRNARFLVEVVGARIV